MACVNLSDVRALSTALHEVALVVQATALLKHVESPEPPTGLTSLPPGVLWHVARRAGLRARRVCRALRDAYGPFDCGLRVDATDNATELRQLLTASCKGLTSIRTLELPQVVRFKLTDWEGVLRSVCDLFPNLEALSWWAGRRLPCGGHELSQLAPLSSTLTALSIRMEDPREYVQPPPLQALQQLEGLRKLSLGCTLPRSSQVQAWLQGLRGLPQLLDFSWVEDVGGNLPGEVVSGLAQALPQLTSLVLGAPAPVAVRWDLESAAALHHGFPRLERLSFRLLDVDRPICLGAAVSAALAGALSRRRGLSSLQLAVCLDGRSTSAEQLSSLQLSGLTVGDVSGLSGQQAQAFWRAVALQRGLTRLCVCLGYRPMPALAYPPIEAVAGGLVELQLLGWDPAGLHGCFRGLTRLTRLCLARRAADALATETVRQLCALTQLRHLDISETALPAGIVRGVSCLTRLRELRLQHTTLPRCDDSARPRLAETDATAAARGGRSDADLAHLAALGAHLTSLDLTGFDAGLGGRDLSVLTGLAHLQRVCLGSMWKVDGANWPMHLLPLPAGLCRLELTSATVSQQACDSLLLAAAQQGCRVLVSDSRLGWQNVQQFDSWAPAGGDYIT